MLALEPEGLLLVLALGPEGLAELQGQLAQRLGPVPPGAACGKTESRAIASTNGRMSSTRTRTIDQGANSIQRYTNYLNNSTGAVLPQPAAGQIWPKCGYYAGILMP